MTRDQVITNLFHSKNFRDCISKMEPEHLRDDLKSEVMLIVCGWDEDKVVGLYERKELEFYVVRVILNLVKSNTSPFYKMYRTTHTNIDHKFDYTAHFEQNMDLNKEVEKSIYGRQVKDDVPDLEQRQLREQVEDIALAEIDNLYWYDKELLLMYKRLGNFRAIEAETGIPYVSCYKNIKKSLETLKRKALSHNPKPIFTKEELHEIAR